MLIVGASDAGELALRVLRQQAEGSYRMLGFLDEDTGKRSRRIGGVAVVGEIAELEAVVRRLEPDLILDTGVASPGKVREVCRELGIEWRPFAIPMLGLLDNTAPQPERSRDHEVADPVTQAR